MGIKMTLHIKPDYVLIGIDIRSAYNTMRRAAILERHRGHMTMRRAVPYWRAKLGTRSPIWAEDTTMWGDDGLQHRSPTSGPTLVCVHDTPVRETGGQEIGGGWRMRAIRNGRRIFNGAT